MANKLRAARELRGELMLQISAGCYFRDGVELHETPHRRTIYTNAWISNRSVVGLPVGRVQGSTDFTPVSTAMVEALDRLEATRWDNTDDFLVATGGNELVDDIAYVMTFTLNRTFSRNHDLVYKLIPPEGETGRRAGAASLFPGLFEPRQVITDHDFDQVAAFMTDLLALDRDSFARVMRAIRSSVDATRRAVDDPTGAYTDLVAALESLADKEFAMPTTWANYDGAKRKVFDRALEGESPQLTAKVHAAALEADHVGLTRRFVSSTLARITSDYYRTEAIKAIRPPRSADIERMLEIAYRIRSRRSHLLDDLGEEAWVFADGAEVTFEPAFDRILTLAGLWRLLRHVVGTYVASAPKVEPEPWDYRDALPGQITAHLDPRYWIGLPAGLDASTAEHRFNGVTEAIIDWLTGNSDEGFDLREVAEAIESLVPLMPEGNRKGALVGIYAIWHKWAGSEHHRPDAQHFMHTHETSLNDPSPSAFATWVLAKEGLPNWTPDQWVDLATERRECRMSGREAPLPPKLDALLQLETADRLEAVGRHSEALTFAAHAVEEFPGDESLLAWERQLIEGSHDPNFDIRIFLFGSLPDDVQGQGDPAESDGETEISD